MFEFIKKLIFGTSVALSPIIDDPSLIENKAKKTVTFNLAEQENGVEILIDTQDDFMRQDKILLTKIFNTLKAKESPFVFLDIGAGVGNVCLMAKYFPSSRWFAIEPIKKKMDLLRKNIGLNQLFTIDCFEKAILNRNDKFTYQIEIESSENTPPTDISEETKEVDAISVDLFCREQGLQQVDFLKIKATNNEWKILLGAKECLIRDRPVIFLDLSHRAVLKNTAKYKKFLKECNYKTRNMGGKMWVCTPIEQLSITDKQDKIRMEVAV
jgi:FkbM family methyltransferase